jgi:hypothetical protein
VISATLDTSVYIRALHFGAPATVIIGHARAVSTMGKLSGSKRAGNVATVAIDRVARLKSR